MKNKIAKITFQQGDVVGRKLDAMPPGEQKSIGKKRLVLAEGEHTGHSHTIQANEAELIMIGERMLLKLTKKATVSHQEHNPITLSPGIWEIGRVQEYDWFSKMQRQVMD